MNHNKPDKNNLKKNVWDVKNAIDKGVYIV